MTPAQRRLKALIERIDALADEADALGHIDLAALLGAAILAKLEDRADDAALATRPFLDEYRSDAGRLALLN